jgi:hypothetical protein
VNATVCVARNGAAHGVCDSDRDGTTLLGHLQCRQRVCCLTGLTDKDANIISVLRNRSDVVPNNEPRTRYRKIGASRSKKSDAFSRDTGKRVSSSTMGRVCVAR